MCFQFDLQFRLWSELEIIAHSVLRLCLGRYFKQYTVFQQICFLATKYDNFMCLCPDFDANVLTKA